MPKVMIFLASGFEEIEAITVVDVLRRADIEVSMVSLSSNLYVTGSHSIQVVADELFEEADFNSCDMMILPGGPGTKKLLEHNGLVSKLVEFNEKGKMIAAICAAPRVLGKNGILEGHKATCYPGVEEDLVGSILAADKVVVDSNIITSKGPGTSYDFVFKIVELLTSKRISDDLKKGMIVTIR